MKNKLLLYCCGIFLLGTTAFISCESEADEYKNLVGNEITSDIGGIKDVTSLNGNNRIAFEVAITADPRISSLLIEWKEEGLIKSHTVEITRENPGMDTISVALNDVSEGSKMFVFSLWDDQGNSSATYEHGRRIYGPMFAQQLFARRAKSYAAYETDDPAIDSTVIVWGFPSPQILGTTLNYTDRDGVVQEIKIPGNAKQTSIKNYDISVPFSMKTWYYPEEGALDSLESGATELYFQKVIIPIDKANWKLADLNNDIPNQTHNAAHVWLTTGFDGIAAPASNFTIVEPGLGYSERPFHFTLDVGDAYQLTKFRMDGFYPNFNASRYSVAKYQVWGIKDTTNAQTTIDLQDISEMDDDDKLFADLVYAHKLKNLEKFEEQSEELGWSKLIDEERGSVHWDTPIEDTGEYRFLRIVMVDTYNHQVATAWSELSFWAYKRY